MSYPCRILIAFLCLSASIQPATSQDLFDLFDDPEPVTEYVYATFKGTRVVTGQSIENPHDGNLVFLIGHRFGRLNSGSYEFWGLDQATIRLGLEYGFTPRLAAGVGRSSFEKTYDGFVKYKVLRQATGAKPMPVSLSLFSGIYLNSLRFREPDRENHFTSRLSYAHQILLARKFSNLISLQLTPTFIHRNLVEKKTDPNDIYALGLGGRLRLTNRITLNAEYFHVFTDQPGREFTNALTVGFDIETGGHIFQLHFTNAQPFFEPGYIAGTSGNWLDGDIYFGFNISRVFTLKKPKL